MQDYLTPSFPLVLLYFLSSGCRSTDPWIVCVGPHEAVLVYTADFASLIYRGRSTQAFTRSHLQNVKINERLEMLEQTFTRSGLCQHWG